MCCILWILQHSCPSLDFDTEDSLVAATNESLAVDDFLQETDLVTGNRISTQPAKGSLYMSGAPILDEDLKFTLYIANFDRTVVGSLVVKNQTRDYLEVANASAAFSKVGEVVAGETLLVGTFANTKAVSIAFGNSFSQGMTSGATGTVTYFSSSKVRIKNESLAAKFLGGEKIRLRVGNATTGAIVGNSTGGITGATTPLGKVAYYDTVNYANAQLHLETLAYANSGTASYHRTFTANTFVRGQTDGSTAKITSVKNIRADLINFVSDYIQPSNTTVSVSAKMATSQSARDAQYQNININTSTLLNAPRYVLSSSIESNTTASTSTMSKDKSGEFKLTLTSTSRLSSPAVDLGRTALTVIENMINTNTAIQSTEDGVKSGGLATARYISRRITLADGQDAEDLKVYVTAYKPSSSQVHTYYKILHAEDPNTFDDAKWIPMTQNTASGFTSSSVYSSSEDTEDFIELTYDVSAFSNLHGSGANTNNSGIVEYRNTARSRYIGFKHFALKIVLTGSDTSRPPRLRDFRAIALQK